VTEVSLLTALLAGFLGGAHCVGMCGGIVAAMSFQGGQRQPFRFHLGYNLGRLASYVLAGALAGLLGSAAFLSDRLLPLQTGLYVLAQVMLVLLGLYIAGLSQAVRWIEALGGALWRRLQPGLGRWLPIRSLGGALAAGAIWGWLPCGLVYSVLVSALASGRSGQGALLMLAFGIGTLPNLLAMGWAAEHVRRFARSAWVKRGAGSLIVGFGVFGLANLLPGIAA